MTSDISVSVVVPVLNDASTVRDTLQALVQQRDIPKKTEIVIVDGGSTDGTQDVIRRFPVKLLEERKPGPGAARNLGLREAKGDVIAHLDGDTIPVRRWLHNLVEPFRNQQTILAGGRIIDYCPSTAAERYIVASGLHDPVTSIFRRDFPFVPSINMAVRRESALAIGGWKDQFITGEDEDFSFRLMQQLGARITYVPDAVVFHRGRKSAEELRVQAWTYGQGAAHVYLSNPEVLSWGVSNSIKLTATISRRTLFASLTRAANMLGLASWEQVEFAVYHRFWTWWWWRGFFDMWFKRRYTSPPKPRLPVGIVPELRRQAAKVASTTATGTIR